MSPLRMNWVRKCDHETGPSICGISNDISVSRRTSVNWVTLGKTLIGGSEGELERAVGEVAPADGRQRAEQEVAHVPPKIADDRGQRGQLHRS